MAISASKRKNLTQISLLVAAVVVVIAVSALLQNWWNNRPGPQPLEIAISASNGDETQDVYPFSACTPGVECEEHEIPTVAVAADGELTLELPKAIYDHDWALLKIYDDPAANSQDYFTANQTKQVTIPGQAEATDDVATPPRLVVVEVTSVQIGIDDAGEETPYTVTWSIAAQEGAESAADAEGSAGASDAEASETEAEN